MARTMAVVLFTDLVGSTELRGRLGEDAADELRRRHDQLLAQAVEANNGSVVKGLGDGIMATFAGAADAVAAAVAVQQAIDRLNRSGKAAVPLAVRVGVSAGDVAFEDDDVHGTPVIEASRLCAEAGGGEILASEVVGWLGGSQGALSLTPVGSLELKGLVAPVPAVRVDWEPAPASSLPMPALLTGVGRNFVGREAELERLARLWKEAAAGERRVALLAGEPGLGKTRLAAEVASRVHADGGVVLAGRCDEDLGVPYQPFVEALRFFVDNTASDKLIERLGRYAGELARLVPELTERLSELPTPLKSDPETERYRLFDAVAAWLGAGSAEEPLMLVLDDIQWAAKPTLLLLRHVLRFSEPLRVLVVATYRDSDIGRGHPMSDFLADLRRESGVERFPLPGLDTAGVTAFIEAAAGHRLEDEEEQELPKVVWRETEGNPFFVAEVLRHLAESRAIEQREGRWVLTAAVEELGIPEGVRDVVGRRLSHLPDLVNRVLSVAAVIGLEFEPAVVGHAGDLGDEELLGALDEAAGARLVTEVTGARYRFAHALVRATLFDELSGPRRIALHRKVAEAIETVHGTDVDDQLPALAYHWAQAAAPAAETERAVSYASRAGDRALSQLAHDEAVRYYRQALELLDATGAGSEDSRRTGLLISLGEAQRRAGDAAYRETLLAAARLAEDRADVDALARAALANNRGMMQSSVIQVDHDRVAVLDAALAAAPASDSPNRARLLANLGLELAASEQRERRIALSDQALTMARHLQDDSAVAHVLTARFYTLMSPDTLLTRLSDTAELVTIAERLADPVGVALAHFVRARVCTEHGDVDEARSHLQRAEDIANDLGQPTLLWYMGWARVGHLLMAGRLDDAETLAREAGRLAEVTNQPDGPLFLASQLLAIRREQGRIDEVEPFWRDAIERFPQSTFPRAMLALILAEMDQTADAAALLRELAADDFTAIPVNNLWLFVMVFMSIVAGRVGDDTSSATLVSLLAPYADQIAGVSPLWLGSVSHFLGVLNTNLSRFDEADGHFIAAASVDQRVRAPCWLAHTRLEWARLLITRRQSGDDDRARQLLGQALDTARELALAKVERDAVALLQECS